MNVESEEGQFVVVTVPDGLAVGDMVDVSAALVLLLILRISEVGTRARSSAQAEPL